MGDWTAFDDVYQRLLGSRMPTGSSTSVSMADLQNSPPSGDPYMLSNAGLGYSAQITSYYPNGEVKHATANVTEEQRIHALRIARSPEGIAAEIERRRIEEAEAARQWRIHDIEEKLAKPREAPIVPPAEYYMKAAMEEVDRYIGWEDEPSTVPNRETGS